MLKNIERRKRYEWSRQTLLASRVNTMSERAKVNHSEQYKRTNRTKLATHIYSVRIIINNIIIYYYSKGKYMYVDK